MKKRFLFFVLFLNCSYGAAEEFCMQNNDKKMSQFTEDNCDIVNKMHSCAQISPDPDAIRKRIENLLHNSDKDKAKIQKQWKIYQSSLYSQMFNFDPLQARNNTSYVPEHLMDWISNGGNAKIDIGEFKAKLIDNYINFAEKFDCTPLVKHRNYSSNFPQKSFKNQNEINMLIKSPDYLAERDKYFEEYNKKAIEKGRYCYTNSINTRGYYKVAEEFPPCAGNVSGLFSDNEWSVSTLNNKLTSTDADEITKCIKNRLALGAEIERISISSSASSLNNTGKASERFCKKGFLGLSQARAENAKKNILPLLFNQSGKNSTDYNSKVSLNYKGINGDGTSGPCAYTLKEGKEVLKDEFKTLEGKKALDEFKFIRINVSFAAKKKLVNNK